MINYEICYFKIIKGGLFMSDSNDGDKFKNMMRVGNFTKHAIENFEENIVEQKDYLEKVKKNQESNNIES